MESGFPYGGVGDVYGTGGSGGPQTLLKAAASGEHPHPNLVLQQYVVEADFYFLSFACCTFFFLQLPTHFLAVNHAQT